MDYTYHKKLTGNDLHQPFKIGDDADKAASPISGDWYFATDTHKLYRCATTTSGWESREINDYSVSATDLWSAQKIDNELNDIVTISGVLDDHNHFDNLDGGTLGEYYHLTESEHTALTSGIDCIIHTHDDRYYTETEVDDLLTTLSGVIDLAVAATRICNTTGDTLTKGTAVTICGLSGALCCVCKSDNREFTKMPVCGVVDTDIANGAEGNMIRIGKVDLNTSGMAGSEGDRVYVQGDGSVDTIIPTSGGVQRVGFLTIKAVSGSICVCIRGRKSIYAAKDEHPILRMGNDVGHQKVVFKTYTNDEVAVIDSSGNLTLSGTVDNVDVATFKSDYDSHVADVDKHREINDSGYSSTDLWSAQKIDSELDEITTISGVLDDHNHFDSLQGGTDNEYYHLTESEHTTLTSGNDCTIHKHDDRYYTETEVDSELTTLSGNLQTNIDSKDNYSSWSFAVDGATKDAITSADVLDFVGGDNITITRSAEDQITISGSAVSNIVEDTTPQLGGDLDVNGKSIDWGTILTVSGTYKGDILTVTVDDASTVFGNALYCAADFHYERCVASSATTMSCRCLALESGAGSKKVLLKGQICDTSWNWTSGDIYISPTVTGSLTQTLVSGTGEQLQLVGFATHANRMYFNPNTMLIEME